MSNPKKELLKLHFRAFFREPGIIFWAILFPILMAWVLGLAFTEKTEIRKTIYLVGPLSGLDSIAGKSYQVPGLDSPVTLTFSRSEENDAVTSIKRGIINLYIEEKDGQLIYNYDPLNPDAVNTHLLVEKTFAAKSGSEGEIKAITATGNRYIDFLVPGLIALGIMNSCMWGISYNLIEYRMKKLLRRMLATPMRKSDFLFSQFIFRVIICTIETILLVLFAVIFFDMVVQGSWLAFILLFLSGIICFTGLAILIASRTQNTQVGNGLINAVILPMTILSGIFFSYQNFPEWAQTVIRYFPLTILAEHIRAVFNEGAGVPAIATPLAVLTATGIVCYIIGLKVFKWY